MESDDNSWLEIKPTIVQSDKPYFPTFVVTTKVKYLYAYNTTTDILNHH